MSKKEIERYRGQETEREMGRGGGLPSPLYCSLHTRSIPLNPLPPLAYQLDMPTAGKVSPKILKKEIKKSYRQRCKWKILPLFFLTKK
jgi:hypothetical protein